MWLATPEAAQARLVLDPGLRARGLLTGPELEGLLARVVPDREPDGGLNGYPDKEGGQGSDSGPDSAMHGYPDTALDTKTECEPDTGPQAGPDMVPLATAAAVAVIEGPLVNASDTGRPPDDQTRDTACLSGSDFTNGYAT